MTGGRPDVVVLGGGAMGSAAAAALARRGRRVVVLERDGPAGRRGSSHGGTRLVRQAYFEGEAYVPLVRRAYQGWRDLEAASGRSLLTLTGGVTVGRPDGPTVTGTLTSARRWGLAHEVLDADEARRRVPTLRVPDGWVAVFEETMGFVRPEAAVRAQLAAASAAGAEVVLAAGDCRWAVGPGGGPVVSVPGAPDLRPAVLVVAPGPSAPEVLGPPAGSLRVERRVQFWFRPNPSTGDPARFDAGRHPAFVCERPALGPAGELVYGFPAVDGEGLVKVGFHHWGGPATPDTLTEEVTGEEWAEAARVLDACLPGAAGTGVRADPCLYTRSPDDHFVIGRHPHHPRVVVACGFSGHGFKFAPAVGEVLADLADGAAPAVDLAMFDPARLGDWRR